MTGAEINCQALATKEVKAQQSVNAGAWWQGVAEHGKIDTLLPQRENPTQRHARCVLYTAPRSDLRVGASAGS